MNSLSTYLKKETIRLNISCQSWEEAVRAVGELLCQNGIVESSYIDAMVNNVKKFGPYIVLLPGFALAHARCEDGAKKVGMSLVTLKEPVKFGHEDNDPVSVVVGIASTADEKHVQFLAEICDVIKDEEKLKKVMLSSDIDEVISIFTTQ